MPLLPPQYFSNWYVVSLDGKPRILSSFQEQQNNQTQLQKYVQGDIGNHIVDWNMLHMKSVFLEISDVVCLETILSFESCMKTIFYVPKKPKLE